MDNRHSDFMQIAVTEADTGIQAGHGGPFGAVIVKDGEIVGRGHNSVLLQKDPTAHGEVMAIRDACRQLDTFHLEDCALYTTAEPCPMCLGAILWAGITEVYYGCSCADTADIGFRDSEFYEVLAGNTKLLRMETVDREACQALFARYQAIHGHILY